MISPAAAMELWRWLLTATPRAFTWSKYFSGIAVATRFQRAILKASSAKNSRFSSGGRDAGARGEGEEQQR
eukprot:3441894-Pyramimonas_sp.AAC.1